MKNRIYATIPESIGANSGEEISRHTQRPYTHAIIAEREQDGEIAWVAIGWTSDPERYMDQRRSFYARGGHFDSGPHFDDFTGKLLAIPAYRK